MTDQWHEAAFRLKKCEEGMTREAGDGYFASSMCEKDEELNGDTCGECEVCKHTTEFSAWNCELCGTPKAGSRACVVRIHPLEENLFYAVCVDCEYFVEYGQLDDQSMLDIEDDQDRR